MTSTSSPWNPNKRKDVAAAEEMLRRLLPLAIAAADKETGMKGFSLSGVAAAAFPYWRIANVVGVHIYQTERGWYGDIILKGVPDGISNVCGTPTHLPHKTRFLAEDGAVSFLQLMVLNDRGLIAPDGAAPPEADCVPFDLDHVMTEIPFEAIAIVKGAFAALDYDPEEAGAFAEARLLQLLAEDFGADETTAERLAAMPQARRQLYFTNMSTLLAARGQFRVWRAERPVEDYEEHMGKVRAEKGMK